MSDHFKEQLAISVFDHAQETNLQWSYECYSPPCAHYIDQEGKSYKLVGRDVSHPNTTEWIEEHGFKKSCYKFKAPPATVGMKLHWMEAKKYARDWYDANLRGHIEPYLRKFKISYVVDMDPEDWDNIASFH